MSSTPEEPMVLGRRERKKNDTRHALVAAASRLFSQQGLYSTTIEEITDAADLGKGTFYKHFDSREALLGEVLHDGFALLLSSLPVPTAAASLQGEVRAIIDGHAAFFRARPEYLLIFHQARGWLKQSGEGPNPIRDELRAYVAGLAGRLGTTREGATLPPERRERSARILAGLISGTFSFEAVVGSGEPAVAGLPEEIALLLGP